MHAIRTRDRAALSKSYKRLEAYLGIHFRHEEILAEAINFPFAQNRIEQQQLLDEMNYMMNILEDMYRAWPDNVEEIYSGFLNGWMTNHIKRTDMQLKSALGTYPYNFMPP